MNRATEFALKNPLVVLGGLVALYVLIRGPSNVGKDLGGLIGGLGSGAVTGAASAAGDIAGAVVSAPMLIGAAAVNTVVATASNPETNPLHGFGSEIGQTFYDWTH